MSTTKLIIKTFSFGYITIKENYHLKRQKVIQILENKFPKFVRNQIFDSNKIVIRT